MKRVIYGIFMFLLVASSLVTALTIAYAVDPEFFNWVFDWIGFTAEERAYFTTAAISTTTMAYGVRILKQVVNTDNLKRDAIHKTEMTLLQNRYTTEIDTIKSDFGTLLSINTEKTNEVITNQNVIINQNQAILNERRINATRMIGMSDNLVPQDIKLRYQEFLTSTEIPKTSNLRHFYSQTVDFIKHPPNPIVTEIKQSLSQRIKARNEVSNL